MADDPKQRIAELEEALHCPNCGKEIMEVTKKVLDTVCEDCYMGDYQSMRTEIATLRAAARELEEALRRAEARLAEIESALIYIDQALLLDRFAALRATAQVCIDGSYACRLGTLRTAFSKAKQAGGVFKGAGILEARVKVLEEALKKAAILIETDPDCTEWLYAWQRRHISEKIRVLAQPMAPQEASETKAPRQP
jgi:hypothetical protein